MTDLGDRDGVEGQTSGAIASALRWTRHLVEYAALRTACAVCGSLPERIVRRSGEVLGYASSFVLQARLGTARRTMSRVMGPDADSLSAARRVFRSYGRYWAELFWLRPERLATVLSASTVTGLDHLRQAHGLGQGVVIAMAHVGNWEVGTCILRQEGLPVLGLAESLPNPRITDWFVGTRAKLGIEILLTSAVDKRRLVAQLRHGHAVALMADRDLQGTGPSVSFFGDETTLPSGPVALADRTGAALIPAAIYFRAGRGHRFVIRPPLELPRCGDRRQRIKEGTQMLADALEQLIADEPTQWHLLQPNWPSDRCE